MTESAVLIQSPKGPMVGIEHIPPLWKNGIVPVIIVVGGPDRVGSHRQFVLLARSLCSRGVPVLRFDCTGMGDSPGEKSDFLKATSDLGSAIDYFSRRLDCHKIALWGLCDAVSLMLMYLDSYNDKRVAQIFALNPWVRQTNTEAEFLLKSYYFQRLASKAFWSKLIKLEIKLFRSIKELIVNFRMAINGTCNNKIGDDQSAEKSSLKTYTEVNFVYAMKNGLKNFEGQFLLIISGKDMTAGEFLLLCQKDKDWQEIIDKKVIKRLVLADANHTFSSADWRKEVEDFTCSQLCKI